jgi:hypothetical protein
MAFDNAHAPMMPPTADPLGPHVSASCFEFLLIELVPLAYRLTGTQAARDAEADDNASWMLEKPLSKNGPHAAGQQQPKHAQTIGSTVTGTVGTGVGVGGIGGAVEGMDEEETREAIFWRLDGLGYRVGLGLVDR